MRLIWLALLVVPVALCADNYVVVELFTSEGCSSCPSAERMLASLEQTQPVPGVRVIALEEHVDYWNQLGWKDMFSSPQFRFRQNDYAKLFGVEEVYTPQMVVGGLAGFSGNSYEMAIKEITKRGAGLQDDLRLTTSSNKSNPSVVDLHVAGQSRGLSNKGALLYLAITESGIGSNVTRGENSGRYLKHASLVRSFGVIGTVEQSNPAWDVTSTLQLPADWKRENLRAVVFLQDKRFKRISCASELDLH